MSLKTTLLIIFLALVTAGLLYLALYKQTPAPQQVAKITPTPTIFLSPAAASTLELIEEPASNSSFTATQYVSVVLDTGKNYATAVQVELAYDPKIITNINIRSNGDGTLFPNYVPLINNIDTQNGRISYAIGVPLGSHGVNGQGQVMLFSFNYLPTSEKQTTISFLPKSLVTAEGALATVLKKTENLTLTIPQTRQ